jgi:hypothetical protein
LTDLGSGFDSDKAFIDIFSRKDIEYKTMPVVLVLNIVQVFKRQPEPDELTIFVLLHTLVILASGENPESCNIYCKAAFSKRSRQQRQPLERGYIIRYVLALLASIGNGYAQECSVKYALPAIADVLRCDNPEENKVDMLLGLHHGDFFLVPVVQNLVVINAGVEVFVTVSDFLVFLEDDVGRCTKPDQIDKVLSFTLLWAIKLFKCSDKQSKMELLSACVSIFDMCAADNLCKPLVELLRLYSHEVFAESTRPAIEVEQDFIWCLFRFLLSTDVSMGSLSVIGIFKPWMDIYVEMIKSPKYEFVTKKYLLMILIYIEMLSFDDDGSSERRIRFVLSVSHSYYPEPATLEEYNDLTSEDFVFCFFRWLASKSKFGLFNTSEPFYRAHLEKKFKVAEGSVAQKQ